MSLGQNLAKLLKRKGWDQYELAEKVGAAQSSVSDWVADKTFPRRAKLEKLAVVFETTIAKLVG
jgi:transcriptional regulator with XRE-family HTH domain